MTTRPAARQDLLLMAAIILLGLNLRPVLAAVGPLLDTLQRDTGLSDSAAGLLTTLPVLVMGLGALGGGLLHRLTGTGTGIAAGLALIAAACALRGGVSGGGGLIASAIGAGLGIALVQALLPAVIKGRFPDRAGPLMGLYTTGIMGGAAVAAASAAPLGAWLGWSGTLAVWAVPAAGALALWLWVRPPEDSPARRRAARPQSPLPLFPQPFRSRRAWLLMVFFGLGTGGYTLVLAWLPPYYTAMGWSAADSGLLLGGMTLTEVAAGLAVSALIGRFADRRPLLLAVLGLMLAGLGLLAFAPALAIPAVVLAGLGIGALFPLSLIITLDHAHSPQQAGSLMGFVQGGGYVIASVMPVVAGLIREGTASLTHAWTVMIAVTGVLVVIALRFSRSSSALPVHTPE
ncbi:MFS transporter [Novispirillum itersonii]|uniref:MFS transporter n=1 Tax=Novispirillum itersonii TaxID=189 RepID=UPI00035D8A26|nr:MFS transporter [Novispirillum itersonii]